MSAEKFESPINRLQHWTQVNPNEIYLSQPIDDQLIEYSRKRVLFEVSVMANYLQKYPKGSHVAIFSLNCAHWIMADLAIQMAGHVSIPIYPTAAQATVEAVLEHSKSCAVFMGKMFDPEQAVQFIPEDIDKIAIYQPHLGMPFFDDIVSDNEEIKNPHQALENDLLTVVYTSGTTGDPKGVMVSYRAINAAIQLVKSIVTINSHDRFVSYLPLAHVAERMSIEFAALYHGSHVSFIRSLETFTADVKNARVTIFFGVPRIWTKIKSTIEEKLGGSDKTARLLNIPVIGFMFKKMLLKKLGFQRVRFALSAAAAINLDVLKWFNQLGLKLNEAYGMSETCGLSHMMKQNEQCAGSVGKTIDGCEMRLSDVGEILLRNPAMMDGYYKQDQLTAQTIDDEGWLHTGDLGTVNDRGYLFITGRLKDNFKTTKGKYIAPVPIEKIFQSALEIEHVVLMGDGFSQPFLVVSTFDSPQADDLHLLLQKCEQAMTEFNLIAEQHERVSHVFISDQAWTTENGLLTPTLKLKRTSIERLYHLKAKELMKQSAESVMQISLNY